MFISKRRWQALVKRVADLEGQAQSQQGKKYKYERINGNIVRTPR